MHVCGQASMCAIGEGFYAINAQTPNMGIQMGEWVASQVVQNSFTLHPRPYPKKKTPGIEPQKYAHRHVVPRALGYGSPMTACRPGRDLRIHWKRGYVRRGV